MRTKELQSSGDEEWGAHGFQKTWREKSEINKIGLFFFRNLIFLILMAFSFILNRPTIVIRPENNN